MTVPTKGWILWAATTGFDGPLPDRLAAAAAAGYDRVSLSPVDVLRAQQQAMSAAELGRMAADLGLEWVIDPLISWLPAGAASRSPFASISTPDLLAMAEDLGAVSATAIALTSKPHSPDELAEHYAALCDAASDLGLAIHLEFIPMTVVTSVGVANEVAAIAGRPNGGILFDTWHFFRGDGDLAGLSRVDGRRIFAVQINDAPAQPQGSLWDDTFERRLPGDGAFDLASAMAVLEAIGGLSWIGPEVFSHELAAVGALGAARLARERVEQI